MPNEPGQDNTLQHAEVILRCRRGRLLQHLNRQEYSQAHLFLTKEIIPLKESIIPYVNVDKLKTEIDYLTTSIRISKASKFQPPPPLRIVIYVNVSEILLLSGGQTLQLGAQHHGCSTRLHAILLARGNRV